MLNDLSKLLSQFTGELASLSSAALWALGSVIYGTTGRSLSALELNLLKVLVAILCFWITLFLQRSGISFTEPRAISYLVLSGILGIGFSDTFLFEGLKVMGSRRILLLKTIAPPLTALLAMITLQEQLSPTAWIGIVLVIGGVGSVIAERTAGSGIGVVNVKPLWVGVLYGILASVGEAVGSVLSRTALIEASSITPLQAAVIRLVSAVPFIGLWMLHQRQIPQLWQTAQIPAQRSETLRILGILIFAAFASTYLGIWMQQTGLKYTEAGIAQTLTTTSPLFVLPMVMILGERISIQSVVGVLVAIAGVALCFVKTHPFPL